MRPDEFLPGWGATDAQLQILIDMDAIYDEAQANPGPRVDLGDVIGERESGQIDDAGRGRLRQYVQWGWLRDLSDTFDPGGVDAELTAAGRQFVEEIRSRRNSALMRRRAMRQAVATWILEQHAEGIALAGYDNFLRSRYAIWYGVGPITAEEYGTVTYWLRDSGFAEGSAAQGHGLIAVKLTPLGESLVDAGRNLNDVVASTLNPTSASATSYVTSIVNSPGANVAAGSPGARQKSDVTITQQTRDDAYKFADLIEARLPEANPDVDAQQIAKNVRAAADSRDAGKLRTAITGAQLAFASAIGTDAGNALWEATKPLLHHLGMG